MVGFAIVIELPEYDASCTNLPTQDLGGSTHRRSRDIRLLLDDQILQLQPKLQDVLSSLQELISSLLLEELQFYLPILTKHLQTVTFA